MPEAPVASGIRTVRVPDGTAGRIDRFVADATGLSRSHVQKLISDGRLTVDGVAGAGQRRRRGGQRGAARRPGAPRARSRPGARISRSRSCTRTTTCSSSTSRRDLVVHPSPGHHDGDTLVNALLARAGGSEYGGIAGVARPGIVHRLDRDTSGLLMVAKHDAAQRSLMAQLKARRVRKTYQALVVGKRRGGRRPDRGAYRARPKAPNADGRRPRRPPVDDRVPGPRAVRRLDAARARPRHRTDPPDPGASRWRSAIRSRAIRSTARARRGAGPTAWTDSSCMPGGSSSRRRATATSSARRRHSPTDSRRCSTGCAREATGR